MFRTEELRGKWRSGEKTFGLWLAIPSPATAELAAISGADYVCIDQQHGLVGYESMVSMLIAIGGSTGPVPITRVPSNDPSRIALSLDAGACGIVVPMVNTAAEAARAVAACRYPPAGVRSFGPVRAARIMGTRDPTALGEAVLCIVMVETAEGLSNVDAIAQTPGVDAIYVGPADLAVALGLPPGLDRTETEHIKAVQLILDACKRAGIAAGIQCGSGESARRYAELGFSMVTVAKDNSVLERAFRQNLDAGRGRSGSVQVAYS